MAKKQEEKGKRYFYVSFRFVEIVTSADTHQTSRVERVKGFPISTDSGRMFGAARLEQAVTKQISELKPKQTINPGSFCILGWNEFANETEYQQFKGLEES